MTATKHSGDALAGFHPAVARWFTETFPNATSAQAGAWPALLADESTLLLAPTGSGKTLAAFLHTIDRLMFSPKAATDQCSVIYVSPLKALAVDVERNLQAPLAGIAEVAAQMGTAFTLPSVMIRTGDTPSHHARIALLDADLRRPRRATPRTNRYHR
jgi:ATP-dependent helicase Lhr and Lhr-like helicase